MLKSFKNKRKVLITPGIVDLGTQSEEINKKLGMQAAEAADFVILVGVKQAGPIAAGLKEAGYNNQKIYIADNLNDALEKMKEVAKENSIILLENDLPDNYL